VDALDDPPPAGGLRDDPAADALPTYELRRSRRARRASVRIEPDRGLVVTLPQRAAAREADRVVRELAGWIAPRLVVQQARRAAFAAEAGALPVLGERLALVEQEGRRRVHRRGAQLLVPAGEERDRAIEAWLRGRAREEAGPRLDEAVAALGVRYGRLRITDTRSRWGSCSSTGTISLSWRLLLAPPDCLDYVVWHEACHLVHAHHGATFWALLEQHRPGWREPAAWLRRHGGDLRLWLADAA